MLRLFIALVICLACLPAHAQDCPPNIDFESGTFNGWTCYIGSVADVSGTNVISLSTSSPTYNRHTMYSSYPGDGNDPYGGFPINCPNGSGHSIRLGNDLGGGEAEGISYEFTIPAGRNVYNLIYHYAVVFQDPNHLESQQPRMEIEITNVTDNKRIDCSSFAFHPFGSVLPGFALSDNPGSSTPVWYKPWSAVSINLDGNAGKTIRLFFKTADCTFRRHFGYAYIDVNSECSGEFVGAAYCPDDTAINVIAPYGYQTYTWFNKDFTQQLGATQTLRLSPPPPSNTTIAVALVPYNGYGCLDTLYAHLLDTLTVTAFPGPDVLSCNRTPVRLGTLPRPGLVYRWSPSQGLSDPTISNPLANPTVTTRYTLTASNSGGGCVNSASVLVSVSALSDSLRVAGKPAFCIDSEDSAVLYVQPAVSIQWYKDNVPILGATQPRYRANQSGSYYALLTDSAGCSLNSVKQIVFIDVPKPGISYPIAFAVINLPLSLKARQLGDSVVWHPPQYLDNPESYTPVFKAPTEQQYTIELKSYTGCVTVDTQLVKTVKSVELFVPSGFTPNNDGINDYLRPILMGVKELRYFRIFNRMGQLLFESKNERTGWDGKINGYTQPSQTVVWVIEGLGVDNVTYRKKGTTVLIR